MSNTRRISRRSFVLGAIATTVFTFVPGSAYASKVPIPVPAPSFTTTVNAPRVLSAHCGVRGRPMANPVPRDTTMQVSAVMSERCMVKVQAWPTDAPSLIYESLWIPTIIGGDPTNPINVAKFWMPDGTGAPGRAWEWQTFAALLGTDPNAPVEAAYGTGGIVGKIPFCPAPGDASAFSFAAGSCSQVAPPGEANRTISSVVSMAASNIAFFVHLGDTTYVDTWKKYLEDTPEHIYTKYGLGMRCHFLQPDLAHLYYQLPVHMVPDDHESGPDNCYAATVLAMARQVFGDIAAGTTFDNLLYDLVNPGAPTYDTWVNGQVQFFQLDNRYWRDTPGAPPAGQGYASQLGVTQRNWLKNGLAASTSPIKVILSPRAFKQFYALAEQQELLDWITGYKNGVAHVTGTVVFLTGDMHAGAVWKLSAKRDVFEMQCSPILNITLHTPTAASKNQLAMGYQPLFFDTPGNVPGVRARGNAWGKVDIGADASVTLNLMDELGSVLFTQPIPAAIAA